MNISLEALANIGEVIGAAAVVASLLYLAIQVRQSTQAQRTENFARALERVSSMQATLSQDEELTRIFSKGVQDATELSSLERIRFTWALYEAFDAFEFMYQTHQTREIPDEVWKRWSMTVAWWLSFPGVHAWWVNRPVEFTASFTDYVDGILRDNPTDQKANTRWQTFVATGSMG